jgi:hypothetical protein
MSSRAPRVVLRPAASTGGFAVPLALETTGPAQRETADHRCGEERFLQPSGQQPASAAGNQCGDRPSRQLPSLGQAGGLAAVEHLADRARHSLQRLRGALERDGGVELQGGRDIAQPRREARPM